MNAQPSQEFLWALPDVARSGAGRIVELAKGGGKAFIPAPLRTGFASGAAPSSLAKAQESLAVLYRMFGHETRARMVARFNVQAVAVTPPGKSIVAREPWRDADREKMAYLRAAETKRPVTELLRASALCGLHAVLLGDGDSTTDRFAITGQLRSEPGGVANARGEIAMVFAPPEAIPELLDDLAEFIAKAPREEIHPVAVAAMIAYQLGAIHPFSDGNGRLARLLAELWLSESGAARTAVPLSIILRRYRGLTLARLNAIVGDGAWPQWIEFFATVISGTVHRVIDAVMSPSTLSTCSPSHYD